MNNEKNYLYDDRIIAIVKNTRVRDQEEKNKNFIIY